MRFVLLVLTMCSFAVGSALRPNVLFLLTDDQRHDTIASLGNDRIKTPHIDSLVKKGTSFKQAHIMGSTCMAVCTPSRASLFSGRLLWSLESQSDWDFAISERYVTMAEVFRKAGYVTFATGKNDPGFGDSDHFTRSFSEGDNLYYRGGHRGNNRTPVYPYPKQGKLVKSEMKPVDGRFNADHFADAAVAFLTARANSVQKPFFAYVSFMTPHDPFNAPEEYLSMYQDKDMVLPENYLPQHPFDAGVHHIRDEKLFRRPLTEQTIKNTLARYYALVTHTDAQIGRILKALEDSGEADNTIIVFSSDNGLALGSHGLTGKQNVYQHGVRVPLIMAGPGIPKRETRDQLCYLYDIYPTLCELAGLAVPGTVHFKSLKPVLKNPKVQHRDNLYFSFMKWQRAVRDERYKLIEFCVGGKRTTRLYDLQEDPSETKDLAGQNATLEAQMKLQVLLELHGSKEVDDQPCPGHIKAMSEEFWTTYQKNSKSSSCHRLSSKIQRTILSSFEAKTFTKPQKP